MDIDTLLKKYREQQQLTQQDVADKLFVSRQSVSNWELNKNYPDIIKLIELSELYEVTLDELVKGDDNMVNHLKESTDIVKKNKQVIAGFTVNMILFVVIIIGFSVSAELLPVGLIVLALILINSTIIMYHLFKNF